MMTKKHFWQGASNWGFLAGIFLFAADLICWLMKLPDTLGWLNEFMHFIVISAAIVIPARRHVLAAGAEGYSYGRSVGFVFATMLFAGIIYGVGLFLMMNFIAVDHYDQVIDEFVAEFITGMTSNNPALMDQAISIGNFFVRMFRNPFALILVGMIVIVGKGGVLGLVLSAFLYRKPDIFAQQIEDGESGSDESGNE